MHFLPIHLFTLIVSYVLDAFLFNFILLSLSPFASPSNDGIIFHFVESRSICDVAMRLL